MFKCGNSNLTNQGGSNELPIFIYILVGQ